MSFRYLYSNFFELKKNLDPFEVPKKKSYLIKNFFFNTKITFF